MSLDGGDLLKFISGRRRCETVTGNQRRVTSPANGNNSRKLRFFNHDHDMRIRTLKMRTVKHCEQS